MTELDPNNNNPTSGNSLSNEIDLRPIELGDTCCEYIESFSEEMSSCLGHSDLSVLQLNIRGLFSKQDELHRLLNKMGGVNKVDVVSLNETWLRKETVNKIRIKNYQIESKVRKGKKGGGVSILIRNELKYRRKHDLEINDGPLETIVVEVKTNSSSIIMCSAYRPPNTSLDEFRKGYDTLINRLTGTRNGNIVVAMDHNLDLLKLDDHQRTHDFFTQNINNDLYPCITKPTRVTHFSATLIDNIFVTDTLHRVSENYIIQDDISDHYPCLAIFRGQADLVETECLVTTRPIKEQKLLAMKQEIANINWLSLLENQNCKDSFKIFHTEILTILDKHCPEKPRKVKSSRKMQDPWITGGILRSLSKQKQMYAKCRKVASRNDSTYKTYKATLQRIIRKSKENYFLNKCKEFKTNAKKLWAVINTITKKETNKHNIVDALKIDNLLVTERKSIAEEFGKYFSDIGKTYAQRIPKSQENISHYLSKIKREKNLIYLTPVTNTEVDRLIRNLQPKPSSGHDGISNKLLKGLRESIVEPLQLVINKSLCEGIFPSDMKKADVSALHKTNDRMEKSNYRPISLLLTLSKILEKIVYKRVCVQLSPY